VARELNNLFTTIESAVEIRALVPRILAWVGIPLMTACSVAPVPVLMLGRDCVEWKAN
jgi:hypothetical protein